MPASLFFHNTGPNLAQIPPPKTKHTFFSVVVDFQWNMLENSINFDNFCCNPIVLKKNVVKPLKIAFSGPICTTKGSAWGHAQHGKQFSFGRNNKSRSSAFRNFLFYQSIICFGWVMNLFLFCVMFFIKKGSFPAEAAVPFWKWDFWFKVKQWVELWRLGCALVAYYNNLTIC